MKALLILLVVMCGACSAKTPLVLQGLPGQDGTDGRDGADGRDGNDGRDGSDGGSCSVTQTEDGAIILCDDGTSAVILNGDAGAYSITEIINPCGDQTGFDEVLLRLNDGSLLAHYSHGSRQFLTLVTAGSYVTTDGHACYFTVDANGLVSW